MLSNNTFFNRVEFNNVRAIDSFLILKNSFLNAPFIMSNSNFSSICILRENKFYEFRSNFCIFNKYLDFSLSELKHPFIFIENKITNKEIANFHFSNSYWDFKFLKYLIKNPRARTERFVQNGNLAIIEENLHIMPDQELENYINKANQQSKTLLQNYKETTLIIRKILADNGNHIEASFWNNLFLYSKEIELDSKENKTLKEQIEKWQLWFYRITSDHHTDLLKILGWILCCIASFAGVLFYHRYQCDLELFMQNHEIQNDFLHHLLIWAIDTKLVNLFCFLFIPASILSRYFTAIIGFIITFAVVAINPKYILGIGGLISGSIKVNGMFENIIFVVYTIIMFLLIFSLQKTARKNSIVPN